MVTEKTPPTQLLAAHRLAVLVDERIDELGRYVEWCRAERRRWRAEGDARRAYLFADFERGYLVELRALRTLRRRAARVRSSAACHLCGRDISDGAYTRVVFPVGIRPVCDICSEKGSEWTEGELAEAFGR